MYQAIVKNNLETNAIKFKAKQGLDNQLFEELTGFDNSSSKSWQILILGDNEYLAVNTNKSIESPTVALLGIFLNEND